MTITMQVWKEIRDTLGAFMPECGGILGMRNHIVTAFFFDSSPVQYDNAYFQNVDVLNQIILQWSTEKVQLVVSRSRNRSCTMAPDLFASPNDTVEEAVHDGGRGAAVDN